ncbi:MAG: hypothetical protein IKP40_08175 [Clostridia bacterium]|nr:hypothetical protein [Clostridia bacterium]
MKRFCLMLLTLTILCASSFGEDIALTDRGLDLGANSVHWPELTGLEDEALQEQINLALRAAAGAEELTARMGLLFSSPTALKAEWQGQVTGGILSVVTHAEGPLRTNRAEERWGTALIDLTSGKALPLSAFLADQDEAVSLLEERLEESAVSDLSAHQNASAVTPLPETFAADRWGLTFFYSADQLSTLSGKAGTLRVYWYEIEDLLALDENSPAARLGAKEALSLTLDSWQALLKDGASGSLPLWPVAVGDPLPEAIREGGGLLSDPDLYMNGRLIELQDDRFRGTLLLTDALNDDIGESTLVQGLRSSRFGLYGLHPGLSREEVLAVTGAPEATVTLGSDLAAALRLPSGTSDYYPCAPCRLCLHYDENGLLAALALTE